MEHDCSAKVMSLLEQPNDMILMRTMEDALAAPNCPVCRMFVHVVAQYQGRMPPVTKDKQGHDIHCHTSFGFPRPKVSELRLDTHGQEIQNVEVTLDSFFAEDKGYAAYGKELQSQYRFHIRIGIRELSTADRSVHIYKRKHETEDGTIHREFLVHWIESFTSNHRAKCYDILKPEPSIRSREFRLVDVHSLKVEQAPRNGSYVALSYVWGANDHWLRYTTDNRVLLEEDSGILRAYSQLPRTIRDAIVLTRQMKQRYLWVDSLCILQDDLEDKMKQIPLLHTIYENADLVIVAAYGCDADAGLPGVEPRRFPLRTTRRREHIHDKVRLLSGCDMLEKIINNSVWRSRGWTYQEFEMSRAQLILTPVQAYLRCQCGSESDETIALDVFNGDAKEMGSIRDRIFQSEFQPVQYTELPLWNDYSIRVRAYSKKKLTAAEDILDGFSAIVQYLERKFHVHFFFGLPLSQFNTALRWTHADECLSRRECVISICKDDKIMRCPLPSWSWVGWIGGVTFNNDMNSDDEPVISEANWRTDVHHMHITEDNPLRHVLIQALTSETYFDLGERQWNNYEGYGYPILDMFSNKKVGHIGMPNGALSTGPGRGRFIYHRQRRTRTTWYKDSFILAKKPEVVADVLLVTADKDGICFRIGLASINWNDWLAARPMERIVTLA